MSQLTPEQKKILDRLAFTFFLKCLWNGVHSALLLIAMNLVLSMGDAVLFGGEFALLSFILSVGCSIFILKRAIEVYASDFEKLKKDADEAIK